MWSRIGWMGKWKDANSPSSLLGVFFLSFSKWEVSISAAMAPKGKNGLEWDITLQKINVAVVPVHRQDPGLSHARAGFSPSGLCVTAHVHASLQCTWQWNLGTGFSHITEKLKPMSFMPTNTFRSFLQSGICEKCLSGWVLGFTMILPILGAPVVWLQAVNWKHALEWIKLSWKECFCSYMGLLSSPEILFISFWKCLQQSKLDMVASHLV